jgi:hypothetical protein
VQLRDHGDVDTLPLRLDRRAHAGQTRAEDNHIVSNHQEPPKTCAAMPRLMGSVRGDADARKDVTGVTMVISPFIARLFAKHRRAEECPE